MNVLPTSKVGKGARGAPWAPHRQGRAISVGILEVVAISVGNAVSPSL